MRFWHQVFSITPSIPQASMHSIARIQLNISSTQCERKYEPQKTGRERPESSIISFTLEILSRTYEKTSLFSVLFPYVCPEPVLAKRSFIYII